MRNRCQCHVAGLLGLVLVLGTRVARAAEEGAQASQADGVQVDAHVNVLGPLQFGLTPTIEVGAGHWAGLGYFRWLSSGLYAHSALPNREDQKLMFSYGLGVGGRYYFKPGLTGLNLGLGVEYLHVDIESSLEKEAFITSWAVPQLEFGYRLRFGRLLLGFGLAAGYAVSLSARTDDLSNGSDPVLFTADDSSRPFASAAIDVGFYF